MGKDFLQNPMLILQGSLNPQARLVDTYRQFHLVISEVLSTIPVCSLPPLKA